MRSSSPRSSAASSMSLRPTSAEWKAPGKRAAARRTPKAGCVRRPWGRSRSANGPSRPIRLVVPFTPGGGADIAARQVAARLSEQVAEQVVIDNRGGLIGMKITADASSGGYTLLFNSASYGAALAAHRSAPTWLKTLAPVIEICLIERCQATLYSESHETWNVMNIELLHHSGAIGLDGPG